MTLLIFGLLVLCFCLCEIYFVCIDAAMYDAVHDVKTL